jgi:hypothetical protein
VAPVEQRTSLAQRLMWFVLLWLGGVGAVTLVAAVLRFWLKS